MKTFFNTLIVLTVIVFATNVYAAKLSCEGTACGVVRLIFLGAGKGYMVKNSSKKRSVVVGINWMSDLQCTGVENIQIAPLKYARRNSRGICGPLWTANYKKIK